MLFIASGVVAEDISTKSYRLADHGFIQLQVPQSWRDEIHQPEGGLPPTIVFSPRDGTSFQILITPLFSPRKGVVMPTPDQIKRIVQRTAEHVQSQAVQKTISINELKGPSAIGYYFSVTDRSPKPGEYKYMTQGMLRVGELVPTFTILTNDGAESVVADSLSMLRGAKHVDKAS